MSSAVTYILKFVIDVEFLSLEDGHFLTELELHQLQLFPLVLRVWLLAIVLDLLHLFLCKDHKN